LIAAGHADDGRRVLGGARAAAMIGQAGLVEQITRLLESVPGGNEET